MFALITQFNNDYIEQPPPPQLQRRNILIGSPSESVTNCSCSSTERGSSGGAVTLPPSPLFDVDVDVERAQQATNRQPASQSSVTSSGSLQSQSVPGWFPVVCNRLLFAPLMQLSLLDTNHEPVSSDPIVLCQRQTDRHPSASPPLPCAPWQQIKFPLI